ncbi:PadR family transcriptional regulator [Mycobacterium avium]|uniref:PadR family transcriptional regulator n=1 Tax=Mycobacterium avium TaxID=1764 RepID=UPI00079FDEB5|nr:MarR family transcriptional regulator [Mycobacterium avium]MBG0726735.1 MarR family transcriptional regulator [Mycobacterium avium]PBJ54322.1 MarR family transcriptional regulator [Mycobacterium avium subsp. hominissuis]QCR71164.1 MarR family transcriptional regulator [Mycobacterium avium subsp. hominissuis]QCR78600.1 MarR family transcriptional regulator [Mycobacterium avium subsp. hominissuis]QCR81929.1 MarR family transcriptional regulator [Mycobacterium avium subsp. hominissuis]
MSPRTSNGLPVTAYLVLGVLAANDERLTAGEIKTRAELSVGHFYWSPSVSHVRRELTRLLARGMVAQTGTQSGKRAITLYETTDAGRDALRRWVQHFPGQDQVVIKHPVILKTWLARGEDPERIVDTLERHLDATRARLDEALWSRRRSQELGITEDPEQRFSFAVLDYAIRGLYAEISNISQLRDEIAGGTSRDPVKRVRRSKGQIRRRAPRSPG